MPSIALLERSAIWLTTNRFVTIIIPIKFAAAIKMVVIQIMQSTISSQLAAILELHHFLAFNRQQLLYF